MTSKVTCLSIDCPERYSVCCHSQSVRTKKGFVCEHCNEPFVGGKCRGEVLISPPPQPEQEGWEKELITPNWHTNPIYGDIVDAVQAVMENETGDSNATSFFIIDTIIVPYIRTLLASQHTVLVARLEKEADERTAWCECGDALETKPIKNKDGMIMSYEYYCFGCDKTYKLAAIAAAKEGK